MRGTDITTGREKGWLWKGKGDGCGFFKTRMQLPQAEVASGWLEQVVMSEHTPRAGQAAHRDEGWVIKN